MGVSTGVALGSISSALRSGESSCAVAVAAVGVGSKRYPSAPVVVAFAAPAQESALRSGDRKQLEASLVAPRYPPSNPADDPLLGNPLARLERMGCGWLGAIVEWEGVLSEEEEYSLGLWGALAEEEGRRPPPAFLLRRAAGMKTEQAIAELLCWSRNPQEVRRLASRWEDMYEAAAARSRRRRGAPTVPAAPAAADFVQLLKRHRVPVAVASARRRRWLQGEVEASGVAFDELVCGEDVQRGKPEPDMFLYAAQRLAVIPPRCIVFGCSNASVEAAHEAGMKCVALASPSRPAYELAAADLVVRSLADLCFVDLKKLAAAAQGAAGNVDQ